MHVMDVAQALNALHAMAPLPQTLNLPGPTTHTYAYLLDLVSTLTYNPPSRAPVVPKALALLATKYADKALWWPMLTPDEVERRFIDDVGAGEDEEFVGDWNVVGVQPDEIEKHAITYVRRYRSAVNYTRPIVLPPKPVRSLRKCWVNGQTLMHTYRRLRRHVLCAIPHT